jgi:thiol-disulfide isomerase/thioredoxin
MLIGLTSRHFVDDKLNRTGLVIVVFYTGWYPFCMLFKPQFEEFAKKGNVDFGEANLSH